MAIKKINTDLQIEARLLDGNGSAGTSGQILSSTGTATDWISLSEISGVDGTGTANYVAKWSDTDTITNSVIYDDGTNVGIGTTNPTLTYGGKGLHIENGDTAGIMLNDTTGAKFNIAARSSDVLLYTNTNHRLRFGINGQEKMRIETSGNVGIGTTSPSNLLHLLGNSAAIRIEESGGAQVRMAAGGSTGYIGTYTNHALQFLIDANTAMYINTNRNVGIGTTSPLGKLTVVGSGGQTNIESTGYILDLNRDNGMSSVYNSDNFGTLSLGAGGIENYLYINWNGNIGIGTTSPGEKLQVNGAIKIPYSSTNTNFFIQNNDSIGFGKMTPFDNSGFYSFDTNYTSNGGYKFKYNGSEKLRIDHNGNVGIGTTSPGAKLEVNSGTTNVTSHFISSDNQAWISIQDSGSGTYGALIGTDSDAGNDFAIANASAVKTFVINSGNVGIGTTSPSYALDVKKDAASILNLYRPNSSTAAVSDLDFSFNTANATESVYARIRADVETNTDSAQGGDLSFHTANSGTVSEKLRITQEGNVGIGTTSPYGKLNVIPSSNPTTPSAANQIVVGESSANSQYNLRIGYFLEGGAYKGSIQAISGNTPNTLILNGDGGNVGIGTTSPGYKLDVAGEIRTSSRLWISTVDAISLSGSDLRVGYSNSNLLFRANSAERMRIDSSGNVGIGTTSPEANLHVKINDSGATPISQQHLILENNSATGIGILTPSTTSGYLFFGDNNDAQRGFISYSHISDSMSFKVSGSERMRIDSSGNVGIGTTSPQQKLQVASPSATSVVLGTSYLSTNNNNFFEVGINANDGYLNLKNSGVSTTVHIDSDGDSYFNGGNVGIGTSSPLNKLHVSTSDDVVALFQSTDAISRVEFADNNTTGSTRPSIGASGNNTIFTQGSTERMRIDSSGNVGIGTTSPGKQLTLSAATPFIRLQETGAANKRLDLWVDSNAVAHIDANQSAQQITFRTASTDRLRIANNGNVGIGTTSPAYTLDVNGTLHSSNITLADGIYHEGDTNTYINFLTDTIQMATAGSVRAYINSLGNVGIGTTSPASQLGSTKVLDISSTGNGEIILDHTDAGVSSDIGLYSWNRNNDHLAHIKASCDGATDSAFISFHTQATGGSFTNAASNERVRITSTGNVGIGTNSPASRLHVQQTLDPSSALMVYFEADRTSSTYGGVNVRVDNLDYGTGMRFYKSGIYDSNAIGFLNGSSTVGNININASSTSYNTTSDYRLKENVTSITDGITRVKQLQPKRFNFIGDTSVVDGFIAHEAKQVVPEAVTGDKDEVLPNGDPVYQGIDQAKIVPLLTAALQEAITKIEELETRIQTLENK